MKQVNTALKSQVSDLPQQPGIYQFYDEIDGLLYIGKAKNIKKRVQSYFSKSPETGKTAAMVDKIFRLSYVVVETEFDAFLLENNLIKKYQPRYNILLRDDKSFPWIVIRNERFPRVYGMRNPVHDGAEYYGPYASVKLMNTLMDLTARLYPIRNCSYVLSEENVAKKKFKVCLEYQIGNCLGPCEGLHDEEDYNKNIESIRHIIKGNIKGVIKHLQQLMKDYVAALAFEKAQLVKEQLERLEKFQAKSTIVNPRINNIDIFSICSDELYGYVNYLKVVNGAIVQIHTVEMKKKLDESEEEMLQFAIMDIRSRLQSESKEILIPFKISLDGPFKLLIPNRGDKKKLLDLADRNVKYYSMERQQKRKGKSKRELSTERILSQLQKDLRLTELPVHIECFDNSNFQGNEPVAAMSVFRNTRPAKKDYRHYNIKTVTGPDDYASMEEVIYRRYKRLKEGKEPLPQLIVVDGGKGQLSAAVKSLKKLDLYGQIAIIGIAKRLEEIYFPGDSIPIYIDKKSESLKIIQQLRNEAHRFGITHHRNRRTKTMLRSELDEIKGIGPSTRTLLLKTFKSVKGVKSASLEELEKVVGKSKARLILEHQQS